MKIIRKYKTQTLLNLIDRRLKATGYFYERNAKEMKPTITMLTDLFLGNDGNGYVPSFVINQEFNPDIEWMIYSSIVAELEFELKTLKK